MEKIKELFFNTINPTKIEEIKEIFSDVTETVKIKFLTENIEEILSADIELVIEAKAAEAYKRCRVPVVVEHGALWINYLNGFPSALSKPMWDLLNDKICTLIPSDADRSAKAISGVCFCDGKTRRTFIEETNGTISFEGKGNGGFQWDPIFIPDGDNRTFAEMSRQEKLKYSQAAKAYNSLKVKLGL